MMMCDRCRRAYKPWSTRGITVDNMGPKCAVILNLVPAGRRRKPRRTRKNVAQIELELTE